MAWLQSLKQKFIRPLVWAISEEQARLRGNVLAQLQRGASILPGGEIENLSGNKQAISIGENTHIRGRLLTYANGGTISLGSWCYVGLRTEIWSMKSITIGDRVLIAHNVNIFDNSAHSKNAGERHAHFRKMVESGHPLSWDQMPGVTSSDVVIEDDVWISCGVTILQGVRIGARSVIAAGAIVTRDVPPDMFYRSEIHAVTQAITPQEAAATVLKET